MGHPAIVIFLKNFTCHIERYWFSKFFLMNLYVMNVYVNNAYCLLAAINKKTKN